MYSVRTDFVMWKTTIWRYGIPVTLLCIRARSIALVMSWPIRTPPTATTMVRSWVSIAVDSTVSITRRK